MKFVNNKKGLSPAVAAVIMVVTTVAVTIAVAAWMESLLFTHMKTEEVMITSCVWAGDSSYADITVRNKGANTVIINMAQVVDHPEASFSFVHGDSTTEKGETAVLRVTYDFVSGVRYHFQIGTLAGTRLGYFSTAPTGSIQFKMEWGTVVANDTFRTVTLQNNYYNPVVVCTPHYTSGVPRTVRLTNVASQSFDIRVQNPSSEVCPNTEVAYLVVEEGVWFSPLKVEARKYSTNTVGRDGNWAYDTRDYGQTYSKTVVVLHQVMSYDDPSWIATYVSKINSRTNPPYFDDEGFRIALNGAEATGSHGNETIGYVIFEDAFGDLGGIRYEVGRTTDSVRGFGNSPPYNTAFSQSFAQVPAVLVATQLEMDSSDGSWIVNHSVSQTMVGLMVDEDQVDDSERYHWSETCGFIAFETEGFY